MKAITAGKTIQRIRTAENYGDASVRKETILAQDHVDQKEFVLAKIDQAVWYGVHILGGIVILRFMFLLFEARRTGFALLVYNLSAPLVQPFQGIFPAPSAGGAYFDTAALLALVMLFIFGTVISYSLKLMSKDTTIEE